jgi:ketosteroid isomerase-like protein
MLIPVVILSRREMVIAHHQESEHYVRMLWLRQVDRRLRSSGLLFWMLLFTLPFALAAAQSDQDANAEREVRDMEVQWRQAWLGGDAAALDRIHADDYIAIPNIGTTSTKAEVIADVRRGVFRYSRMEHSEISVRIYGITGVVVGRTLNEGRRGDRDVSGDFRFTRIYVKRNRRWQVVLAQYTRVLLPNNLR